MKKDFLKQFKGSLLNQAQMKNISGGDSNICHTHCDNCGSLDMCCPPKGCCRKVNLCGNGNPGYECKSGPCPDGGGS